MARRPHSKLRLPLWLHAYTDLIRQRRAAAKSAPKESAESRVYRRLKETSWRDRIFYTLRQRRRHHLSQLSHQPSHLSQRLQLRHRRQQRSRKIAALTLGLGLGSATWAGLFITEKVTLGGVPYRIVETFWNDKTARDAYFSGDSQALHDRLSALGVEEAIKAYYREQFNNEYELDRHIHQIMFDRTGYIGEAYQVNSNGQLY